MSTFRLKLSFRLLKIVKNLNELNIHRAQKTLKLNGIMLPNSKQILRNKENVKNTGTNKQNSYLA